MRKQLASMLESTSSRSRPWQIAFGVALGLLCGCAVNSPAVALCFAAAAFWMPVHVLGFAFAAATSALAVIVLAPTIGQLGQWSLQHPSMIGTWTQLESLPLIPWLGLHNTLVNGGLIIGLIATVPIALATFVLTNWVLKSEATEIATEQSTVVNTRVAVAQESADEDSFVELTSADLKLIENLDAEVDDQEDATAIGEQQRRIDIAAMGVPRPKFPVHNFEIEDDSLEHKSQAESASETKPSAKPAKVPNPYAFDAVERLEELLSGCRVQPHWADANAEPVSDDTSSMATEAVDNLSSQDEFIDEDEDLDAVPTSDEILHRSHEIAGLVDELIASLDDIESGDLNQPPTVGEAAKSTVDAESAIEAPQPNVTDTAEMRFDPAHKIANTNASARSKTDEQSAVEPEEDIQSTLRTVQDELQLRFDQIDISEQFSKPLYQPHTPNKTGEMQAAQRGPIEEHTKSLGKSSTEAERDAATAELEARIDRLKTPSPAAAEQDKASSETEQSSASNESLIHVVQRGHDEALRHLLHHLREIEERVRE